MSEFVPKKQHLREVLLHYFLLKKSAAETCRLLVDVYGEHAPSDPNVRHWFQRFKSGDFDLSDKEREGAPKKVQDEDLMAILDQNNCQTLEEMAATLNVDRSTVGKRLHTMGLVQKAGNWVPHQLKERDIERRLVTCEMLLQRQQRKSFLHRIVTGDEKWIYYENPKRQKGWVKPGEPGPSTPKRNIHSSKVMLCIWWDMKGVVYYELLNPSETINGERYRRQLMRLNRALQEKRPEWVDRHEKLIFHHDNARPHVAQPVRTYLERTKWEVLPHPPYSPDVAPSDYYLFRSMQLALEKQRFTSYDDIRKWVDEWIASKDQDFFTRGIRALPGRWAKVIASNGTYFE